MGQLHRTFCWLAAGLLGIGLTPAAGAGTGGGYADCSPARGIDVPRLRRAIVAAARPRSHAATFFADNVVVVAPVSLRRGTPDLMAYVAGPRICGTGGCNAYLFGPDYRPLGAVTPARLPIRLLATSHHGRRDIGVPVSGGGVRGAYAGALRFDGASYARNPTLPGVDRVGRDAGTVVIGLPGQAADQCRLR